MKKKCVNVTLAAPALGLMGGVVNYIRLLLKYIDLDKVSVTYVAVGRNSYTSPVYMRPIEYVGSIFRFAVTLMHERPDVVHLNPSLTWQSLPLNLILIVIAKLLQKAPVLVFFRGWRDEIATAMIQNHLSGRFLKQVLGYVDYYLVLNESFRVKLVEAGFPRNRILVSPVMAEIEYLKSLETERAVRSPDEVFHVLFLSRLICEKGIWELCEGLHRWQRGHAKVPTTFTIAGDGPEFQALQIALKDELEQEYVRMPGHVSGEEKWKLYSNADVFVFPSYHEGFPNVIIEALAAGLPIIYTPVGALAEVLGPENGIRIELDALSGETLGQALWELYQDPARRQAMAEANRKLAQRYDVKVVCAQMAEIYRQVARQASDD